MDTLKKIDVFNLKTKCQSAWISSAGIAVNASCLLVIGTLSGRISDAAPLIPESRLVCWLPAGISPSHRCRVLPLTQDVFQSGTGPSPVQPQLSREGANVLQVGFSSVIWDQSSHSTELRVNSAPRRILLLKPCPKIRRYFLGFGGFSNGRLGEISRFHSASGYRESGMICVKLVLMHISGAVPNGKLSTLQGVQRHLLH